ncbi:unnamed protein product [Musa textilis]
MLRISPRISPPSYRGCCGRRTAEMSRWNAWDLGLLRIWDRRRRMIWYGNLQLIVLVIACGVYFCSIIVPLVCWGDVFQELNAKRLGVDSNLPRFCMYCCSPFCLPILITTT